MPRRTTIVPFKDPCKIRHRRETTALGDVRDSALGAAEEYLGPVMCVTKFKDVEEAIEIANDTEYSLGAGVWTRDMHQAYGVSREIEAGRVWVNNYHAYPAHAPFGGYKKSGIGRETHKMMLAHYRQTKNMLISYSKDALGFF